MLIQIRSEIPEDASAVHRVHAAAFPTEVEANLVDRLRAAGKAIVSLVAEVEGEVVGHILFSPVTVHTEAGTHRGAGLAPVAVLPAHQGRGVGGRLIEEGLALCRKAEQPFVVVLGHPDYYPRFGFRRASAYRLSNEYGADEAFMVVELRPGALPADGGLVKYAPEFAELTA